MTFLSHRLGGKERLLCPRRLPVPRLCVCAPVAACPLCIRPCVCVPALARLCREPEVCMCVCLFAFRVRSLLSALSVLSALSACSRVRPMARTPLAEKSTVKRTVIFSWCPYSLLPYSLVPYFIFPIPYSRSLYDTPLFTDYTVLFQKKEPSPTVHFAK